MDDKQFHLWGILKPFKNAGMPSMYNTWEYIRPCTDDRRALINLDTRRYSVLEIRDSNGRAALNFYKEIEENK
jgi:predicted small integral membrane protein